MTAAGASPRPHRSLLVARRGTEAWIPTALAVLAEAGTQALVVASPDPVAMQAAFAAGGVDDARVEHRPFHGFAHTAGGFETEHEDPVVFVLRPVLFAPGTLDRLADGFDDARVVTVSPLSNAARHLSVPTRNTARGHQLGGIDEMTGNARLHGVLPAPGLVPTILPAGALVVVSAQHLRTLAGFAAAPDDDPATSIADMALRAGRRGFRNVVDTGAFVLRPTDLDPDLGDGLDGPGQQAWLDARHPWFRPEFEYACATETSALAVALASASAKLQGLRVLIDGSCLGHPEMGTQVQTLSLVAALARRDDVAEVAVAVPGAVPAYAEAALSTPGVRTVDVSRGWDGVGRSDVFHRPFQPEPGFDITARRAFAGRVVVTVQDLIAYQVGAYHSAEGWSAYRRAMEDVVGAADGVVVISHDTRDDVLANRLPVDEGRLFVVENGTDHLRGDEPERFPRALLDSEIAARPFLLVLGTNYAHKNRDIAIAAWQELRSRSLDLQLVLVGAAVPVGSSRLDELAQTRRGTHLPVVLPDVTSDERNWLLRHASALIYPTSAEGFGLVPFEAARFGTPCVAVPFGPLAEVNPDVPVRAASWQPAHIADAVEQLLLSPDLQQAQRAATLAAGDRYTWDRTAAGLVAAYRAVLGASPRPALAPRT
jgi:glycosyltransferase involved in cell wall biosynthesis